MKPIGKLGTVVLTAAVFIGLPTARAAAQSELDPTPTVIAFPTWDTMPPEAMELLDKGDVFLSQGNYSEARESYEQAADIVRAGGGFPAVPLRLIAKSYYYQGKLQDAVSHLDDLAHEAAQVGDIATQAWALADAAWVLGIEYSSQNLAAHPAAKREMIERSQQIRMVLGSPYLPGEVRKEVIRNRCGSCHSADKPPQWAQR